MESEQETCTQKNKREVDGHTEAELELDRRKGEKPWGHIGKEKTVQGNSQEGGGAQRMEQTQEESKVDVCVAFPCGLFAS